MSVNSKMTAIADAIRSKTGETGSLTLDEMADAIDGIEIGVELPILTNEGSASDLLSGKQLIDQEGNIVTGAITTKTASNLTASGAVVTVPAGYYAAQATKSVSTATQATPSIAVDANGLITASAAQTEGYVSAGTKSATKQLTTQAAKTITPSTSAQTAVAAGTYVTGKVTVAAMPTATQATPSISVDSSGFITATATQDAGYVASGTKSGTKQLAFQPAKTITPSTASQIAVSGGYYTGGNITVKAIPSQYVIPSGTLTISTNGTHDVKNYASAVINVEGGGGSSGEAAEWSENEDAMITDTLSNYTNDRVKCIGEYAFFNRESLTSVNFPACATISSFAFQHCSSLTTASFPVCTYIGNFAFHSCRSLTTASFPICTEIAIAAFDSCSSLAIASFPVCTSISNGAFEDCSSLTTISFPACTYIGASVFKGCTYLTVASFPVCATIGSSAFASCYSLTTASFPVCTTIYNGAFAKCYNLKSLYLTGSGVCQLFNSSTFASTPIGGYSKSAGTYGQIYVPSSLVASYKAATNWTYFSSRIMAYDSGNSGGAGD